MQRVIAYVDGFNLYYGLRSRGWKRYYWLNVQQMAGLLLKPGQTLVATKYFTTLVTSPADKRNRQTTYLDALRTLPNLSICYGHYLEDTVTCQNCGYTYRAYHEKMTDVNIAMEMITDAFRDRFDLAFLISADSDLVPAVRAVRQLFSPKRVVLAFPPARYSTALARLGSKPLHITQNILAKSRFPMEIVRPAGAIIACPQEWR